jgi:hypothetical protein
MFPFEVIPANCMGTCTAFKNLDFADSVIDPIPKLFYKPVPENVPGLQLIYITI